MNKFNKKLLVEIGITFGLVAVVGGVMVYVWNDIGSIGESIKTTRTAFATRSQAIGNLSALQKQAQDASVIASQLRNALPSRESLFAFSDEISKLAREKGLTPSFAFGSEISGSGNAPSKIDFTINAAGEYQPVLSFISALENSRYLTKTKSIELLSQGAITSSYQAIISGEVFFRN